MSRVDGDCYRRRQTSRKDRHQAFQIRILHRQRRLWQSLEGPIQEEWTILRNERNAKGQDHESAVAEFRDRRGVVPDSAQASIPCEHGIRLLGSGEYISSQ